MPARPLVEGGRGRGSWTVQICVRSHVRSQMTVNRCVLGPIVATSSAIQSAAGITARRGAQIGSVRGLRASTFSFERSSPTEFLRRTQPHCSPAYRPRCGEESSSGLVFPKNQKPLALGFRLVWVRTHLLPLSVLLTSQAWRVHERRPRGNHPGRLARHQQALKALALVKHTHHSSAPKMPQPCDYCMTNFEIDLFPSPKQLVFPLPLRYSTLLRQNAEKQPRPSSYTPTPAHPPARTPTHTHTHTHTRN